MNTHTESGGELEPYWIGIMERLNADHARGRRAAQLARAFLVAERSAAYSFKYHDLKELRDHEAAIRSMVAEPDQWELEDLFMTFDSQRLNRVEKGALLLELMIRRQQYKPLNFNN